MSFSDTIFLFFLALILFGPKKLPEMARQAGRLLAELRRASNEFKSQIETEIAHLEVQKQLNIPSGPPPEGTVASLSANPAVSESVTAPAESPATLASPMPEAPPSGPDPAAPMSSSSSADNAADPTASTSQASHV